MTTRKESLQGLLSKVEVGDDVGFRRSNRAVFSTPCQDIALQLREEHCRHAYKGSLDAAKALHEAVLPGWYVFVKGQKGYMWIVELDHDDFGSSEPCEDATPARAWLIAIIKALIAQEAT